SIYSGAALINRFNIVEFEDRAMLGKAGRNLFAAAQNAPVKTGINTSIEQGVLEGSNVNPVSEMIDLISTTRVFDGLNNAIRAYSDMESKGTNVLADMNQ
ncbi:MAG: flagellar basal-body rod protein FlgF, partial [Oligoflexia bacterium]|nr:flagellar basal-body rod protein FlgF [Oligoflexia bacterium]